MESNMSSEDPSFFDSLLTDEVTRSNETGCSSAMFSSATSDASMESKAIRKQRQKGENGETIVTTPWYAEGAVKEDIKLASEIEAFGRLQMLTLVERSARTSLKDTLQELTKQVWPGCIDLLTYGSFAVGISVPQSPVDVVLQGVDLSRFNELITLCKNDGFTVLTEVSQGEQAFLKIKKENIIFSLCISSATDVCGHLSKHVEKVKRILRNAPATIPVYAVLRAVLQQTNHNDTTSGGLPSYTLLLMIIFITKISNKAAVDPGVLLVELFHVYGSSPPGLKIDPKSGNSEVVKGEPLFVCDLVDTSHNTAANCTRYMQIRSQFSQCGMALEKWASSTWRGYRGRTPLSSILAYGTLWERCG